MSRLTIDITSQQHQNLKAMAALQGKTIQYALERLFPGTPVANRPGANCRRCWVNASRRGWMAKLGAQHRRDR
jgi:hypothetical protein